MRTRVIKEKKTVLFKLMLTPTEKDLIDKISHNTGLTKAQIVRRYYIYNDIIDMSEYVKKIKENECAR